MKPLLLILTIALLAGCGSTAGRSWGKHEGRTVIDMPDGTRIEQTGRAQGETRSPAGASEASPLAVTLDGVQASISGVWQGRDHSGSIYPIGAVLLLLGAAIAAWRRQIVLAGCIGAAAVTLFALHQYPLASLAIVLAGGAYVGGKLYLQHRTRQRGRDAAAKLGAEGKHDEANAAMRAADEQLDEAWREVKGK
jgi:hypothetical protein